MKIVSGGQTGVDRGALDAALAAGVSCGGWCPHDRSAEDGRIADRYPLIAASKPGYTERTRLNVMDSDATWIIYFAYPSGGTAETLRACLALDRPFLLTDASEVSAERSAVRARDFLRHHSTLVLNVAGPRASGWPDAWNYSYQAVRTLLALLTEN